MREPGWWKHRSETKVSCPFCNRAPGGRQFHDVACPRSRFRMKALQRECKRKLQPRIFWMKGPIAVRLRGEKKPKIVFNPGVPYVRDANNETWVKGGVPMNAPAVEDFLRAIGALK